jgi:Fe-S cluster biosynthesis and repair protein YggX
MLDPYHQGIVENASWILWKIDQGMSIQELKIEIMEKSHVLGNEMAEIFDRRWSRYQ